MFTHGALRSWWELVKICPCVPDRIGVWKRWFLRRGEKRNTREKNQSRSKRENQQQTQRTYGVNDRIRTRARLVGGECSQPCASNRRSQSIEIDIGNQSIHSISIADRYRLISVIDNNRTHKKSIFIDWQKSITIDNPKEYLFQTYYWRLALLASKRIP